MDPRSNTTTQTPGAQNAPGHGANGKPQNIGDAFGLVGQKLHELQEYIAYYLATQMDIVRHVVRRLSILAALLVVAVISAGALVATAIVFFCQGIAEGLYMLIGYHWVADLITGVVILGALVLLIWLTISRMTRSSRNSVVEKYEARRREQHAHFGHDINNAR